MENPPPKPAAPQVPLPVPNNMRTRRALPRAIAAVCTLLWLVLLIIGTQALARKQNAKNTAFDQFLQPGERYWIAVVGDKSQPPNPTDCAAYFFSRFQVTDKSRRSARQLAEYKKNKEKAKAAKSQNEASEPSAKLQVAGAISVDIFRKPARAEINLAADFGSFYRLASYRGSVNLGRASMALVSQSDQNETQVNIKANDRLFEQVLPRPNPVYLVQNGGDNRFSLWVPEQFRAAVLADQRLSSSINARLLEVPAPQYEACRFAIDHRGESNRSAAIDLGRYLSLLRISEDHPVLSQFFQP